MDWLDELADFITSGGFPAFYHFADEWHTVHEATTNGGTPIGWIVD